MQKVGIGAHGSVVVTEPTVTVVGDSGAGIVGGGGGSGAVVFTVGVGGAVGGGSIVSPEEHR